MISNGYREPTPIGNKDLNALAKRVLASLLLRRCYHHDILEALTEYSTYRAPRMNIIDRVEKIRRGRGASTPRTFESTVQQPMERYCGDSDIFCGKREMKLFCWPEGKGAGIWGLNVDVVEAYLLKLEKEVGIFTLDDLTI